MSLWKTLGVRIAQGKQFIADPLTAVPEGFRGRPKLDASRCEAGCEACREVCPTDAIRLEPELALDLGRCVFCAECVAACPTGAVVLTPDPRMAANTRAELVITSKSEAQLRARANTEIARVFKRSLKLRQISAGGCNACELELNATSNVNFDLQRYGIEWVASPRHADALVITGTLTRTMHDAVRLAWEAMADPRFVIAVGACAISGGLYAGASGVDRSFFDEAIPALYVPGCPPHPLAFVRAIVELIGRA
jgi:Ni,Fe-hydrogenase III small subunit/ferredoxin